MSEAPATFYATVRSDEALAMLAELADLTELRCWPLGLPVQVAERVVNIHKLAEAILDRLEMVEERQAVEPERVKVRVGELTIESDGPLCHGSRVTLGGKPVACTGLILAGSVDSTWSLSLDLIPGAVNASSEAVREAPQADHDSEARPG